MSPEITGSLIALAVAILGALALIAPKIPRWIERAVEAYLARLEVPATLATLQDNLTTNTQLTQEARDLSNGRLADQIRRNQNLQDEYYQVRRILDALEMDPDGQAALTRARARLDSLKVLRPAPGREPAS